MTEKNLLSTVILPSEPMYRDGTMTLTWLRFFNNLYQRVGGATGVDIVFADKSGTPLYLVAGSPLSALAGEIDFTLALQASNTIFAGAASGSSAQPTFRSLVSSDLPTTGIVPGTFGQLTIDAHGVATAGAVLTDVPHGGTGFAAYAVGDLLVADTANSLAKLPDVAVNSVLLSGGVGALPTWGTVPNAALANSSVTVTGGTGLDVTGSPVSLGGTLTLSNSGVTSLVAGANIAISSATGAITISTTGTVPSATTASNLAGGAANSLPYQSAASTTVMLAQGTGVLQETAGAPTWTTTPTLTGTNFSSIPNAALTNSSVTIGTTAISLGSSSTSLAGLTTVSASGNITGGNLSGTNTGDQTTVSGNAGTATKLATGRTLAITGDLAWISPAFDGSANVTAAGTLPTNSPVAGE